MSRHFSTCIAIVEDQGRIVLLINKKQKGYEDFAAAMKKIEANGLFSWYGDVMDQNGNEQDGIVLSYKK